MWSHMNGIPYEWRNDTPNAIGCTSIWMGSHVNVIPYEWDPTWMKKWHSKCNRLYVCCICSVVSLFSNLNRWSGSLGLFYHVPLKRDQWDWDWRLRFNDTPNATASSSTPIEFHGNYGKYLQTDTYVGHAMLLYVSFRQIYVSFTEFWKNKSDWYLYRAIFWILMYWRFWILSFFK